MKDPAFLFYPNDYIGGTMGMTFEQKGAYVELLVTQFNRGHMTSHMVGQVLGQNSGQIWEAIKNKFVLDDNGMYYNVRLEIEQGKRKSYIDSRLNNIAGVNQYTKKDKKERGHMDGHMTSHMEDRNRNRNIDLNIPDKYIEIVSKWLDFKKAKKQSYKDNSSIQAMFNNLVELSGDDPAIAEKIVNQSMANNWAGLFELKNRTNGKDEPKRRMMP